MDGEREHINISPQTAGIAVNQRVDAIKWCLFGICFISGPFLVLFDVAPATFTALLAAIAGAGLGASARKLI